VFHRVCAAAVRAPELAIVSGRRGPSGAHHRDNRAVHALARIMLHGRISQIQTSWVKLGVTRTQVMLTAGPMTWAAP